MAQEVYVRDDRGLAIFGILLIPPLAPFYIGLERAWDWLAQWQPHPMYQYAALAAEIGAIAYVLRAFYRYVDLTVAAVLTGLYLAATYGVGVHIYVHDDTWAAGVAVVTGVAGYFLGRALAREGHEERAAASA